MAEAARRALLRRGFALELVTLGWNVIGGVVLAAATTAARPVALAGRGPAAGQVDHRQHPGAGVAGVERASAHFNRQGRVVPLARSAFGPARWVFANAAGG